MKKCAVIMAGGVGQRFWPKSRKSLPKQFLNLGNDNDTMIHKTVNRIQKIVDKEDIYVITNEAYKSLAENQLPMLPRENILAEPCGKNTAPCIAYAAAVITKKYQDAVMIVLPSDHLIKYEAMFTDTLCRAAETAQNKDCLVTLGIVPAYPETGYGYIKYLPDHEGNAAFAYKVDKFVEKPSADLAKHFLLSGKYLWNSGMFVWKATEIVKSFKKLFPPLYDFYTEIKDGLDTEKQGKIIKACYEKAENISIDFGILEKADNIFTIPCSFGWDDVGSWLALERVNSTNDKGNIEKGDIITVNTANTTLVGGKRLIAAVGVSNLIIVDTDDAVLICDKNSAQDIKEVIKRLKDAKRTELL